MTALMPCPFCGDLPEIHGERPGAPYIGCFSMDCAANPTVYGGTIDNAVVRWNRRAAAPEGGQDG